jgi:hypothetical protein
VLSLPPSLLPSFPPCLPSFQDIVYVPSKKEGREGGREGRREGGKEEREKCNCFRMYIYTTIKKRSKKTPQVRSLEGGKEETGTDSTGKEGTKRGKYRKKKKK